MDSKQANWQYTGADVGGAPEHSSVEAISWSASEYIAHEKTQAWLFTVLAITIAASGLLYVIYEEIITVAAVFTAGASLASLGMRKPQSKQYELSSKGLKAGLSMHRFSDFKSFSVVEEGAIDSVWLKPLARFKPPVVIYFAPEDEDRILEVLSNYLPHEQRELDPIDRLSRKIRF